MKVLLKLAVSALALILALTPIWLYLLARATFDPQGFWQQFFLFGVGVWFLGGLQLIMFFVFVFYLVGLWSE